MYVWGYECDGDVRRCERGYVQGGEVVKKWEEREKEYAPSSFIKLLGKGRKGKGRMVQSEKGAETEYATGTGHRWGEDTGCGEEGPGEEMSTSAK
jgi:hypothetical protein